MEGKTLERLGRLARAADAAEQDAKDTRESRNRAIAEADAEGWTLHEISRATGLSVAQVQRIVVKATAARHADAQRPETD